MTILPNGIYTNQKLLWRMNYTPPFLSVRWYLLPALKPYESSLVFYVFWSICSSSSQVDFKIIEMSSWDERTLAVTQTPVKDNDLTLKGKLRKEQDNNNYNNNPTQEQEEPVIYCILINTSLWRAKRVEKM